MASRYMLHKSRLSAFKDWLTTKGYATRDGKGDYQIMQIYVENVGWEPVFDNLRSEHCVIQEKLIPVVKQFIAERSL